MTPDIIRLINDDKKQSLVVPFEKSIKGRTVMWQPDKEIVVLISERDKKLYLSGAGPIEQFPHRVGRHKQAGEFPVMAVRQLLLDQGYNVYVSGLSKVGMASYSLAMYPGQRQDPAFENTRRVLHLDDCALNDFLKQLKGSRGKSDLGRHGGDPDMLVQHQKDPTDRFFVEVKAESRIYKDDLTAQQRVVFPLIQSHLKERIILAKVHILGVECGKARKDIWRAAFKG